MKKLTALLLLAVLAVACAAPVLAEQWTDPGRPVYREVWYVDYGNTVANDVAGSTPMGSFNSRGGEVKWIIERCFAAGFETGKLLGDDSDRNVVPVDLTVEENTVYVYAIVSRKVVIGLLYVRVNVDEGTLTIEGQVKGGEVYFRGEPLLIVYTSVSALNDAGVACEAGAPLSIRDDLDGAQAVLVELEGYVTYSTVIVTDSGSDGGTRAFSLQDYWKNEDKWKAYRDRMLDALNKVAK